MSRFWMLLLGLIALVAVAIALWWLNRPEPEPVPADDSPYWTADDRRVDVDGVSARVRVQGPDNAPVLVMIHGYSFSLESFDAWAADLSADYRVVRMDLTGHALTGPDPQQRYSVPQTVEFVGALLDEMDVQSATLMGNSLGGLVAWRLAADRPDLVDRLVLIAPGGFSINGVTEDPVPVPAPVAFYLRNAPQGMIAAATSRLYGDATRMAPDVPQRVGDLMRTPGVGDALVERVEVFTLPAPEADMARVQAPALILWGGRDVMIPVDHAARMEAALPDARAVIYEDLGHIPHEEDPARTLVDVREFLEN